MYFWGCQQEDPPTWQQGLSLEGGWAEPSCSLAGLFPKRGSLSNNHTEEQPEAITKARSKRPLINCYPATPMSPRRATSQTKVGGGPHLLIQKISDSNSSKLGSSKGKRGTPKWHPVLQLDFPAVSFKVSKWQTSKVSFVLLVIRSGWLCFSGPTKPWRPPRTPGQASNFHRTRTVCSQRQRWREVHSGRPPADTTTSSSAMLIALLPGYVTSNAGPWNP